MQGRDVSKEVGRVVGRTSTTPKGLFDFLYLDGLAGWPNYGQPEYGPNGASACV